MEFEKRCELLFEMKKKRIKAKELAELCNCSASWISQFFNGKVDIPKTTEQKIIDYVANK